MLSLQDAVAVLADALLACLCIVLRRQRVLFKLGGVAFNAWTSSMCVRYRVEHPEAK